MSITYVKRSFKEPKQSYFLFGPRGTGKSTMTLKNHPEATTLLLYRGKERLRKKNVLCMPCEEFLKAITPDVKLQ